MIPLVREPTLTEYEQKLYKKPKREETDNTSARELPYLHYTKIGAGKCG